MNGTLSLAPGFRAVPRGGAPWDAASWDAAPWDAAPWDAALSAAAAGADPGATFWDGAGGRCRAAFVLAPDRPLEGEGVLLSLGALALYDALAVLAPPHVPLEILPPDGLAVDGARAAWLRAAVAPAAAAPGSDSGSDPGEVPDWAVLGLDVAVDLQAAAPGETPDETCLAEEGFGGVAPADVLEQFCRHLLLWIDAWQQGGAAALGKAVAERAAPAVAA